MTDKILKKATWVWKWREEGRTESASKADAHLFPSGILLAESSSSAIEAKFTL